MAKLFFSAFLKGRFNLRSRCRNCGNDPCCGGAFDAASLAYVSAIGFHNFASDYFCRRAAFDQDVGTQAVEQPVRRSFVEDQDVVHACQRSQHGRPI